MTKILFLGSEESRTFVQEMHPKGEIVDVTSLAEATLALSSGEIGIIALGVGKASAVFCPAQGEKSLPLINKWFEQQARRKVATSTSSSRFGYGPQ